MIPGNFYKILLGSQVSEKATNITKLNNQYTFHVANDAIKADIKAAVEAIFKVTVKSIQTLNCKGKTKRTAHHRIGKRNNMKKAYVRLTGGETIDFTVIK